MRSWLAVVLVACGGAPIHESVEQNPDWVIAYRDRVDRGCACKDATCLDTAHAELAQLEADHGGLDEAPPDVQTAHGGFDRCWRAGTRDPARDAAASADEICACTTSECVRTWKLDAMHLFDKYGIADGDGLGSAWQRATACKANVTLAGSAALALVTSAADAMCACKDLDCVQDAQSTSGSAMGRYLDIESGDISAGELAAQSQRFCGCLGNAIAGSLAGALPLTSVSVSLNCK